MSLNKATINKLSEQFFQNWTKQDLRNYLQIMELPTHPLLTRWVDAPMESIAITEQEAYYLQYLQKNIVPFIDTWDEATLRYNFISQVVNLVGFISPKYQFSNFLEANIKAKYQNVVLKVRVEWMTALGFQKPSTPFFFIHEYKPQEGSRGDVVGQLVAAMVAAQAKNQLPRIPTVFNPNPKSFADEPIYGCYILGRHWYFVVLKDTQYAVSRPYDAKQAAELQLIVKILKVEKQRIISLLKDEPVVPVVY